MADFWNIGQARMVHKRGPESYNSVKIVFQEQFPKGRVLGKKETREMS